MAGFILGLWIVQAFGGAYMWSYTTGAGRPESPARLSALPAWALFLHPLIGVTGLVIWIAYLYSDEETLTWVALGGLVAGALVGDLLASRTLRSRRHVAVYGAVPGSVDTVRSGDDAELANSTRVEDLIPRPVIVVHGLLAGLLIVLVLLQALGINGNGDASYELFAPELHGFVR
jgi:hypothetical protein